MLYLGDAGIQIYSGQSGNGWSGLERLSQFLRVDILSSAMAVDLLGNGTTCLVRSSPLPDDRRRPMRYIDLMGGQKPLLVESHLRGLRGSARCGYRDLAKSLP
jgi:hypothetical protein